MDGLMCVDKWPHTVTHPFGSLLSSSEPRPPQKAARRSASADVYIYDDSEEDDDETGYADPVHDDLYARKVGVTEAQSISTAHYDKFLPKFWTPEEDMHVQKIRLGSQRRPWYRKIQGFRSVWHSCKTTSDIKYLDIRNLKWHILLLLIFKDFLIATHFGFIQL